MASFNDSRCTAGCVCSNYSLLFTCKLYHVAGITVRLPNGEQEGISLGDTAADVALPAGYNASLVITEIDEFSRDFHLTLYIANASLLNGGGIRCDDPTGEGAMAACLLCSTCEYYYTSKMLYILGERERPHWLWLVDPMLCIHSLVLVQKHKLYGTFIECSMTRCTSSYIAAVRCLTGRCSYKTGA